MEALGERLAGAVPRGRAGPRGLAGPRGTGVGYGADAGRARLRFGSGRVRLRFGSGSIRVRAGWVPGGHGPPVGAGRRVRSRRARSGGFREGGGRPNGGTGGSDGGVQGVRGEQEVRVGAGAAGVCAPPHPPAAREGSGGRTRRNGPTGAERALPWPLAPGGWLSGPMARRAGREAARGLVVRRFGRRPALVGRRDGRPGGLVPWGTVAWWPGRGGGLVAWGNDGLVGSRRGARSGLRCAAPVRDRHAPRTTRPGADGPSTLRWPGAESGGAALFRFAEGVPVGLGARTEERAGAGGGGAEDGRGARECARRAGGRRADVVPGTGASGRPGRQRRVEARCAGRVGFGGVPVVSPPGAEPFPLQWRS